MSALATIAANARLQDAWAGCLVEVENAMFWIKLAARRNEIATPRHIRGYLENVRAVSKYEEQMTELGVEFHRGEA